MLCNNKYPENAKSKPLLPDSIRRINGVGMNTAQCYLKNGLWGGRNLKKN